MRPISLWNSKTSSRRRRQAARTTRLDRRLRLEPLEDRRLLAVNFLGQSSAGGGFASGYMLALTVPAGSDRLVTFQSAADQNEVTGVTYNGIAMNLAGSQSSATGSNARLWTLPLGTGPQINSSFVITTSGGAALGTVSGVAFGGVNQVDSIDDFSAGVVPVGATSSTRTVASESGDLVLDVISVTSNAGFPSLSPAGGQSSVPGGGGGAGGFFTAGGASRKVGAAPTQDMSWSISGFLPTEAGAHIAANINQVHPAEINLVGNGATITNGDNSPSLADHTDFGSANIATGMVTRTFTVENQNGAGDAPLNLTGTPRVQLSGSGAGAFSVVAMPASVVGPGSSTTFQIQFDPSTVGVAAATVSIANDDANENPYSFAIQGTGTADATAALSGGVLTVTGSGIDNDLTMDVSGALLRITEANGVLGALAGVTQVDGNTVTVPLASVTSIEVNTLAGDDLLTIDRSGGNPVPSGGIAFDGGAQGVVGDALALMGGTATDLEFDFINLHDGSVDIDGSTIAYTGLEPITSTINAANVILNYSGVGETITVTDPGGSQTTVNSTAGEITTFNNPSDSLTINAGGGDDTIDINGLAADYPASLTINGQAGSDTLNVNGSVSLSVGENFEGDADTVNVNGPLATSGAGGISLTAQQNVFVGATVTSEFGPIAMSGSAAAGGPAVGVDINGTTVSTDLGSITLTGQGGDSGDRNIGVRIQDATVSSLGMGAGPITIDGTGGDSSGMFNWGVVVRDGSSVTTVDGDLNITGQGGSDGSSEDNPGVYLLEGGELVSTGTAAITIDATGADGATNNPGFIINDAGNGSTGITSTDGLIDITGHGNGGGTLGTGIRVAGAGGFIRSLGTADIQLFGVGSATGLGNGVYIRNDALVESQGTGSIDIEGTATNGEGVLVDNDADIVASGFGSITIDGDSGAGGGDGVQLTGFGTEVSAAGGAIEIVGASVVDDGVDIDDEAEVRNVGAGSVYIEGTSGSGGDDGVDIAGLAVIATEDGPLTIVGDSADDEGIDVEDSEISSNGGDITLIGTTTSGSSSAEGVLLEDNSLIASISGLILLQGDSSGDDGVDIDSGSEVQNEDGSIVIDGVGFDDGVDIDDADVFTSGSGDITILGEGVQNGIELTGTAEIRADDTGEVTVDGLTLDPAAGAGLVMGDDSVIAGNLGPLSVLAEDDLVMLDNAAITTFSGDILAEAVGDFFMEDSAVIASGSLADVLAGGDVYVGSILGLGEVRVTSQTGAVIDNGDLAPNIVSPNFGVLRAAQGIGDGNALETALSGLAAANSGSGDIAIHNMAVVTLTIGSAGGLSGVTNAGPGAVRLTAWDLNVIEPVAATTGDIDLFSNNVTRTIGLGSAGPVKGSGFDGTNAAFALTDAELDLITTTGHRNVFGQNGTDLFNVHYGGSDVQPLNVFGSAGEDQFFVAPASTMPVNLDGGSPSAPASPGDTLHLDMSGAAPVVIVDTIGGYAISSSTAVVSFTEMESLDLCDDSGEIDNADIGDLYVRTTGNSESIIFTLWNDGGVKLRIYDYVTGQNTFYPQHFGLVGGSQMLSQLLVYAQGGNDYVTVAGHVVDGAGDPIPVEFHGEDGDDYLAGANGDDILVGGPGNDRVLGGEGNNLLFGDGGELDGNGIPLEQNDDGNDRVSGRAGDDVIFGGGGNDYLVGGAGEDYLHAGSGDDLADGGLDNDVLLGADGRDTLSGSYGDDILLGGLGNDRVYGRDGNDVVLGGGDIDQVRGGFGDDLLVGGTASGVDHTTSDAALRAILADWVGSRPTVPSGLGMLQIDGVRDLLIGDLGADAFHFGSGDAPEDRVYDFRAGDNDTLLP